MPISDSSKHLGTLEGSKYLQPWFLYNRAITSGTHLRAVSGGRLVQHTWPVLTTLNIIVHKNNYLGPALLKESLFHGGGGCLAGW